jgi:hypothetical protein
MRTLRRLAVWGGLSFLLLASLYGFQSRYQRRLAGGLEWEMQNPALDPPDAAEKGEYTFARLRYRSPGGWRSSWGTDANKSERQFIQGVRRLTRLHARSVETIIDVDSDEMYNWPWLYAVEVGYWELSEPQAKRLRTYLDRGGFLMVDDFHGTYEWDAFYASLRRVFPDRQVVEIDDTDSIFHVLYNLDARFQVPGVRYIRSGRTYEQDGYEARWRGVYDDRGRLQVAICHNMDLGDAWEWADLPQYPEKFASLAYRIGVNYIIYAMTH